MTMRDDNSVLRVGRAARFASRLRRLGCLSVIAMAAAGCTSAPSPELPPLAKDGPTVLTKEQKDRAIQEISARKT